MDFKWLEGLTVDSVVAFNVFFAIAQSIVALPFLRKYHQRTTSPFGFHPFKRLGTAKERHRVYRFGAFLLILTGLPPGSPEYLLPLLSPAVVRAGRLPLHLSLHPLRLRPPAHVLLRAPRRRAGSPRKTRTNW